MNFRWLTLEYDRDFFQSELQPRLLERPGTRIRFFENGAEVSSPADISAPTQGEIEVIVFNKGKLSPFLPEHAADRKVNLDEYVAYPAKRGDRFDVIFVDGRKRRRCLIEAAALMKSDGVTLLHDAYRPYYHCAFSHFKSQLRIGDILWIGSQADTDFQELLPRRGATAPHVVAIIPARGKSKRLPRKNIYPVLGVPMIAWTIAACRKVWRIGRVYVSTEDAEIAQIAHQWGAEVIDRPVELAGDQVYKQAVIEHAVEFLATHNIPVDVVVSAQANSPEITADDLEAALDSFFVHRLWELFSVNAQLIQNAAFRIMRRETVFQKALSVYCGVYIADYLDVHTIDDIPRVEDRLRGRPRPTPP